ncbi:MAG: type II toxin-antitoxin system RelE/ParE family toxin [Candidatus Aminicenantes bacterium]|nr:type II toxin-antitoxin system RelE/ParE family toxin [Candidatus Aminicenantes bacterium]
MELIETAKFRKTRKKINEAGEKEALKNAVKEIIKNPTAGKKLKGEFKEIRSFRYIVPGQQRRLIYKLEPGFIVLFSFGPREGIYK